MKLRYIFSLFVLVGLGATACGKTEDQQTTKDAEVVYVSTSSESDTTTPNEEEEPSVLFTSNDIYSSFYTTQYVIHHSNHGRLQIFDTLNKTDHIYCFDAGCEHKRAKRSMTGEVIEPGCISYEMSSFAVMVQGEHCYFLNDDGKVYISDLQGENRREVGALPEYLYISNVTDVFYSEDAIFVMYNIDYEVMETKGKNGETRWIAGRVKDWITRGILRIDFADGKCSEVFQREECTSYLSQHDVRDGHLYFAFWYSDIPYQDEYGGSYGKAIPEELTALSLEEYREEKSRRTWVDVYDYNIVTGELTVSMKKKHVASGRIAFCNGFFAVTEDEGVTGLYRYTGERFRELDFSLCVSVWSDRNLICSKLGDDGVYMQIDENTGEVIRRTEGVFPVSSFSPITMIGNSCYGLLSKDGVSWEGYISAQDFWKGNLSNAVQFMREE